MFGQQPFFSASVNQNVITTLHNYFYHLAFCNIFSLCLLHFALIFTCFLLFIIIYYRYDKRKK